MLKKKFFSHLFLLLSLISSIGISPLFSENTEEIDRLVQKAQEMAAQIKVPTEEELEQYQEQAQDAKMAGQEAQREKAGKEAYHQIRPFAEARPFALEKKVRAQNFLYIARPDLGVDDAGTPLYYEITKRGKRSSHITELPNGLFARWQKPFAWLSQKTAAETGNNAIEKVRRVNLLLPGFFSEAELNEIIRISQDLKPLFNGGKNSLIAIKDHVAAFCTRENMKAIYEHPSHALDFFDPISAENARAYLTKMQEVLKEVAEPLKQYRRFINTYSERAIGSDELPFIRKLRERFTGWLESVQEFADRPLDESTFGEDIIAGIEATRSIVSGVGEIYNAFTSLWSRTDLGEDQSWKKTWEPLEKMRSGFKSILDLYDRHSPHIKTVGGLPRRQVHPDAEHDAHGNPITDRQRAALEHRRKKGSESLQSIRTLIETPLPSTEKLELFVKHIQDATAGITRFHTDINKEERERERTEDIVDRLITSLPQSLNAIKEAISLIAPDQTTNQSNQSEHPLITRLRKITIAGVPLDTLTAYAQSILQKKKRFITEAAAASSAPELKPAMRAFVTPCLDIIVGLDKALSSILSELKKAYKENKTESVARAFESLDTLVSRLKAVPEQVDTALGATHEATQVLHGIRHLTEESLKNIPLKEIRTLLDKTLQLCVTIKSKKLFTEFTEEEKTDITKRHKELTKLLDEKILIPLLESTASDDPAVKYTFQAGIELSLLLEKISPSRLISSYGLPADMGKTVSGVKQIAADLGKIIGGTTPLESIKKLQDDIASTQERAGTILDTLTDLAETHESLSSVTSILTSAKIVVTETKLNLVSDLLKIFTPEEQAALDTNLSEVVKSFKAIWSCKNAEVDRSVNAYQRSLEALQETLRETAQKCEEEERIKKSEYNEKEKESLTQKLTQLRESCSEDLSHFMRSYTTEPLFNKLRAIIGDDGISELLIGYAGPRIESAVTDFDMLKQMLHAKSAGKNIFSGAKKFLIPSGDNLKAASAHLEKEFKQLVALHQELDQGALFAQVRAGKYKPFDAEAYSMIDSLKPPVLFRKNGSTYTQLSESEHELITKQFFRQDRFILKQVPQKELLTLLLDNNRDELETLIVAVNPKRNTIEGTGVFSEGTAFAHQPEQSEFVRASDLPTTSTALVSLGKPQGSAGLKWFHEQQMLEIFREESNPYAEDLRLLDYYEKEELKEKARRRYPSYATRLYQALTNRADPLYATGEPARPNDHFFTIMNNLFNKYPRGAGYTDQGDSQVSDELREALASTEYETLAQYISNKRWSARHAPDASHTENPEITDAVIDEAIRQVPEIEKQVQKEVESYYKYIPEYTQEEKTEAARLHEEHQRRVEPILEENKRSITVYRRDKSGKLKVHKQKLPGIGFYKKDLKKMGLLGAELIASYHMNKHFQKNRVYRVLKHVLLHAEEFYGLLASHETDKKQKEQLKKKIKELHRFVPRNPVKFFTDKSLIFMLIYYLFQETLTQIARKTKDPSFLEAMSSYMGSEVGDVAGDLWNAAQSATNISAAVDPESRMVTRMSKRFKSAFHHMRPIIQERLAKSDAMPALPTFPFVNALLFGDFGVTRGITQMLFSPDSILLKTGEALDGTLSSNISISLPREGLFGSGPGRALTGMAEQSVQSLQRNAQQYQRQAGLSRFGRKLTGLHTRPNWYDHWTFGPIYRLVTTFFTLKALDNAYLDAWAHHVAENQPYFKELLGEVIRTEQVKRGEVPAELDQENPDTGETQENTDGSEKTDEEKFKELFSTPAVDLSAQRKNDAGKSLEQKIHDFIEAGNTVREQKMRSEIAEVSHAFSDAIGSIDQLPLIGKQKIGKAINTIRKGVGKLTFGLNMVISAGATALLAGNGYGFHPALMLLPFVAGEYSSKASTPLATMLKTVGAKKLSDKLLDAQLLIQARRNAEVRSNLLFSLPVISNMILPRIKRIFKSKSTEPTE